MSTVIETIKKLQSTTKKTEKEKILKDNDSELLRRTAVATYDKMNLNYWVKKYSKDQLPGGFNFEENHEGIFKLLNKLSSREITGNKAIATIEATRALLDSETQLMLDYLLGRDWKAGLSKNTINKVFPDLIPDFSVALASTYDAKHTKDGRFFISHKLDGVRCIAIKSSNKWKFWSRQGKEFLVLSKLAQELETVFKDMDNIALDGELCIVDENGKEDFSSIMKLIRKKDYTIENPMYKIFDYLPLDKFYKKESATIMSDRLLALESVIGDTNYNTFMQLEQVEMTEESFAAMIKKSEDNGWEGLILRKDCSYKGKRSNDLLKYKEFFDCELVVKDIELGDMTFPTPGGGVENYNCVRSLKMEYKGYPLSVGSGLSKDQRIAFKLNPELIIGKTIQVKYFEETTNQKGGVSLRFPTLGFVYENGRDV